MNHREPEPDTLAWFFRREERLKDPRHGVGIHTHACVAHRYADVSTRFGLRVGARAVVSQLDRPRFYCNQATVRHGIPSVEHKVGDDLLELGTVTPDVRDVPIETQTDSHRDIKQGTQQVPGRFDRLVDAEDRWMDVLFSAEGQELSSQVRRLFRDALNLLEVTKGRVLCLESTRE
jgi:hypothetical protein